MEVIFIEPIYKDYIWGGTKLKEKYNKKTSRNIIAESIEIIANKIYYLIGIELIRMVKVENYI